MRFLVDECTGPAVAGWLRDNGHEIFSVFDEARGMADDDIIRKALSENWILITKVGLIPIKKTLKNFGFFRVCQVLKFFF